MEEIITFLKKKDKKGYNMVVNDTKFTRQKKQKFVEYRKNITKDKKRFIIIIRNSYFKT